MGCRANYVIVEHRCATLYYSQFGASTCIYRFGMGAENCLAHLEGKEERQQLLDWAFAEGGYLLDLPQRQAIIFGRYFAAPGDEFFEAQWCPNAAAIADALARGPEDYLRCIAPAWRGWQLIWDERGVDAFAEYLQQRGINTIVQREATAPDYLPAPTHFQA